MPAIQYWISAASLFVVGSYALTIVLAFVSLDDMRTRRPKLSASYPRDFARFEGLGKRTPSRQLHHRS
jgi:hypothetical protein